jgi:hypothetical protein
MNRTDFWAWLDENKHKVFDTYRIESREHPAFGPYVQVWYFHMRLPPEKVTLTLSWHNNQMNANDAVAKYQHWLHKWEAKQ